MVRRVEVVPWKEEWIEMYRREARQLQAIFGRQLVRIHHIGSTAIPGMSAKPINRTFKRVIPMRNAIWLLGII
ncbi:protein of unknown function UPF0157 [Caldalkalibacillus thermarum TA2.A1]|uniref:GrpB family protein n=1 Tax=Caldalkalibacillus thermarum (strain TA2.A1) TaxID=986075 RepID=F5L5K9_CALTT|nr:protein of unknown function UPF0157 [Caldalkalibacillus thermarum TA2.A1]